MRRHFGVRPEFVVHFLATSEWFGSDRISSFGCPFPGPGGVSPLVYNQLIAALVDEELRAAATIDALVALE
jgi:hypothetical protein